MNKTITSTANPLFKSLLELKTTSGRKAQGRFLIEGVHMVKMAINVHIVEQIIALSPCENIEEAILQIIVPASLMKRLATQVTPQGVLAVCRELPIDFMLGPQIIYLDGVNDPGNLGTIIRSAAAFGIETILLSPDCVSLYNPKALAASQGAIFTVNVRESSIDELKRLKEQGYRLIGTRLHEEAIPLNRFAYPKKFVLVFGSEAHGIGQVLLPLLDESIVIPMEYIESLNVAMAATIIMYDMKYR
ncbi:MAG TPA: RNA methyltransferase [Firmicutes bacterium]|nr:RNA methyltransferase [Bacillota bacterium]